MKTALELAQLAGGETESVAEIARVAHSDHAGPDALVFAQDAASLNAALGSQAGLIFAATAATEERCDDPRLVWLRDAKYGFALAGRALRGAEEGPEIHPAAGGTRHCCAR